MTEKSHPERRSKPMRSHIEDGSLVIYPEGRIDSAAVPDLEEEIAAVLKENPGIPLVIDASGIEYISSAGLRLLLRLKNESGRELTVRNVGPEVYEVLEMTGFTMLLKIQRKLREISTEGCPEIGRGAVGTVYRLDRDTIVKVYMRHDSLEMIRNEQKRARQAFLLGIPTAIPFDVVRVGERYGAVFEMIRAENFNDLVVRHPERLEEILESYVNLMKTIHRVEVPKGDLPDARDVYRGYLSEVSGFLPGDTAERLDRRIGEMPEDRCALHGDIQLKNVMLSDHEPLVIDMETICTGNPVFEFAGLYMSYVAFGEDDPENNPAFFGFDNETSAKIFNESLRLYLEDPDAETLRRARERIELLGSLRFLYQVAVAKFGKPELCEHRIRRTGEKIRELLERVDTLAI